MLFPRFCLLCLLFPAAALAEDEVMSRFTQSMALLHTASVKCQDVLAPAAANSAQSIYTYLSGYYTNLEGAYWVLPPVEKRVRDREACNVMLERELMNYRLARKDFFEINPRYPQSPAVVWTKQPPLKLRRGSAPQNAPAGTPAPARGGYSYQ